MRRTGILIALRRFMAKPKRDRALLIEAARTLTIAWLAVRILPFRRLAPVLSRRGLAPSSGDRTLQISRIGWAIAAASGHLPWQSRCLVQAIAGKLMLRRRGIANVLYLGVAKDQGQKLIAHAWLLSGEQSVAGGAEGGGRYTALTRFVDGEE